MKTQIVLDTEILKAERRSAAGLGNLAIAKAIVLFFSFVFPISTSAQNLKGWDYLYYLLQEKGVETEKLRYIFADPRMPHWTQIPFQVKPSESKNIYRGINNPRNRSHALKFYRLYESYFKQAELRYGVPASVVLAIIQIESGCGRNTGNKLVFYRLARLAAIAEIKNVKSTMVAASKRGESVNPGEYMARAHFLQNTFLPHLIATIELAHEMKIHPLELRGSYSGAIGLPQFLPGNVLEYGVDGNRDDKVDIFDPRDAIPSTAHFLMAHGWKRGIKYKKQKKVIRHYNNSDPYIETVLGMAKNLRKEM